MLDAFIIEEIKRRDQQDRREDRPVVELPVPSIPPSPSRSDPAPGEERPNRGVVIIDFA
ncbi:MAG TPA: hypothetical protein VFK85_06480 [Anaeromyxobacteraceae bacterium]|nr:hypothetical protein [Anaeromyxobacteraceae bacterium]